MAGDVDTGGGLTQVNYGGKFLPAAGITYGSINLQPLMTAMQQRSLNAQRARENELALQQLASREQLAQQEMQLKRDQFAAEGPLREAQIENYRALAGYHDRMGKAQSDAITKEWQYNASLAPKLGEFQSEVNDLPFDVGSDDWWNGYNAIQNKHTDVLATPVGMRLQSMFDARGTRASNAIAQAQQRTAGQLNDTVSRYGIPMSAVSQLQEAVDADQAAQAGLTPQQQAYKQGYEGPTTTSDVWGVNQNGSRFAYFPKSPTGAVDPHAQPKSLAEVNAMDADAKANLQQVTIEKPQVDSIVAASRALSGPMRGSGVAPTWAYSLRGNRGKRLDADTANQFLQKAGGDVNRARDMARSAGFTF